MSYSDPVLYRVKPFYFTAYCESMKRKLAELTLLEREAENTFPSLTPTIRNKEIELDKAYSLLGVRPRISTTNVGTELKRTN